MIEIIPNWHPVFVHFTVALISIAVMFYWLSFLLVCIEFTKPQLAQEFEIAGRWCLWLGSLITIGTVAAGFYAYFTVSHDMPSHIAMTIHRNWALVTAATIFIVAAWSIHRYFHHKKLSILFLIALLIVQGLLLTTAWHGAELVYRHGLGVISLPEAEESGHTKPESNETNTSIENTHKQKNHHH